MDNPKPGRLHIGSGRADGFPSPVSNRAASGPPKTGASAMTPAVLLLLLPVQLPDPGEPEAVESPPVLKIEGPLTVGEHYSVDMENVSMDAIARGRSILRIYPKGQIVVLDGISFIRRKPFITLFPRKAGQFDLIYILQTDDSFFFVELAFEVIEPPKDPPE